MDAAYLIARASELIQDTDNVSLEPAQALEWVNDAMRALNIVRPDAFASTQSITLAAGTKQDLPDTARRLMALVRNMGADGSTPGRAIRGPVRQEDLDTMLPDWHTSSGSAVREYIYNDAEPKVFYVYPGATADPVMQVEAILAVKHVDFNEDSDTILVNEIYAPALIEWICYRYYSRDSENSPNSTRAMSCFKAFFNLLEVKMQVDMAINPKQVER